MRAAEGVGGIGGLPRATPHLPEHTLSGNKAQLIYDLLSVIFSQLLMYIYHYNSYALLNHRLPAASTKREGRDAVWRVLYTL